MKNMEKINNHQKLKIFYITYLLIIVSKCHKYHVETEKLL